LEHFGSDTVGVATTRQFMLGKRGGEEKEEREF
jgi:hypothetical protein